METMPGSDVLFQDLSAPPSTQLPPGPPAAPSSASSQPQAPPLREKNKRPQLSCNPCRARKVKCDRIQPCSACSLHQIAEICQYDLSEAERQPILQAEALKEKDRTISALRDEVASLRGGTLTSEVDERNGPSRKMRLPPRSPRHAPSEAALQSQFSAPTSDPFMVAESGLTHMADDFNQLSFDRSTANLNRPPGPETDIFAVHMSTSYPFPTLWSAKDDTSSLVKLLPPEPDLFFYLESFERRSLLFSFPYLPEEVTEGEVRKFLSNVEHNASLYPDYLALLFATLALGLHDGVFDKLGEKWTTSSMESESKKGDVYIAAAMQCLRLAAFTNRPTMLVIQALVMMAPYLTYSGKFLDASALFSLTVRLAQAIGLHRDPGQLMAQFSHKETMARRTLWWWVMYMDQQYSITLSRPSAISIIGDCPALETVPSDPTWQGIANHITQFTLLSREIMSMDQIDNDTIDHGTDRALLLQRALPSIIQFDYTWLNHDRPLVGWPFDVQAAIMHAQTHNLVIWLNRRRTENAANDLDPHNLAMRMQPELDVEGILRGRSRVLDSCRALLQAFEFFHSRLRAGMVSWTMGQMAFNASMLLTLSMLETGETQDLLPVQHAYSTFLEMNKLGIHKLAGAAVERLGGLMKEFGTEDSANEKVMGCGGMLLLEDPGCHNTPAQRTKLSQQRKRQAKRATAGVTKSGRTSFGGRGQRPLVDRRFSDSVAPRPSQRRRTNRSTPNLSLLTTLTDHDVFSTNSTPAVKTESLFTPTTGAFDGMPQSAFSLTGQHPVSSASQILSDLAGGSTTAPGFAVPSRQPPPQSQQQQQQQSSFLPPGPSTPVQGQPDDSQGRHRDQLDSISGQAMASSSMRNISADQPNFEFSNTSTPYSAEFFDNNLSGVVGSHAFDEPSLNFEHHPFSSPPAFSMSGEAQPFTAGQF